LVGQWIGSSLSPEQYAVMENLSGFHLSNWKNLSARHLLSGTSTRGLNSSIISIKALGFCYAEKFNRAFSKFVRDNQISPSNPTSSHFVDLIQNWLNFDKVNMAEFSDLINSFCGERPNVGNFDIAMEVSYDQEDSKLQEALLKKIDFALEKNQWVAIKYGTHLVTIVGRTSTCGYIIQDSIIRPTDWFAQTDIKSLGEDYQLWPRKTLLVNVKEVYFLIPNEK
jgi:hypothetical protein